MTSGETYAHWRDAARMHGHRIDCDGVWWWWRRFGIGGGDQSGTGDIVQLGRSACTRPCTSGNSGANPCARHGARSSTRSPRSNAHTGATPRDLGADRGCVVGRRQRDRNGADHRQRSGVGI